jgi:hypothetical protein
VSGQLQNASENAHPDFAPLGLSTRADLVLVVKAEGQMATKAVNAIGTALTALNGLHARYLNIFVAIWDAHDGHRF